MARRLVSTPRRVGRDRVLRHALTALSDHAAGRVACAIRAHAAARLGARAGRRAARWRGCRRRRCVSLRRRPWTASRPPARLAALARLHASVHLATAPLRLASRLRLEHGMRRWAAGCAWAADEARRERGEHAPPAVRNLASVCALATTLPAARRTPW